MPRQHLKITFEELKKAGLPHSWKRVYKLLHPERAKLLWLLRRLLWANFSLKGSLTINRTTYKPFSSFKASLKKFSYTWLILIQAIELTGKKTYLIKDFHVPLKFWGRFTKCCVIVNITSKVKQYLTRILFSNHFHEILNLNSRTKKQRICLLVAFLILYKNDTKCDWLEFDVTIFSFYICLFIWRGALYEQSNIPHVENLALNENSLLWNSYIRYFLQKPSHE